MRPATQIIRCMAALGIAVLCMACEEIGTPQLIPCASLENFKPVSNVMERRCGSLDCHGEYSRPLRIYGQNGLRLATREELDDAVARENGTVAGGNATTDDEVELNWRSTCGLEPEKTALVAARQLDPLELMLLRKPLQLEDRIEKHKGGQLFKPGGEGAVCLSCWLRGYLNIAGEEPIEGSPTDCVDSGQNCVDAVGGVL